MHPLDPTAPTWTPTRKLPGALLLLSITVGPAAAGAVTSEPIRIGNVTFPPGIEVLTDFDLRLADLSY